MFDGGGGLVAKVRGLAVTILVSAVSLTGCHEEGSITEAPRAVKPSVSIEGVGAVQLNAVRRPEKGSQSEISRDRAEELAMVWATTRGILLRDYWEKKRGAPIDWDHFVVCGETRYAATPLRLRDLELPRAIERGLGPWWLVTLCGAAEPQLSVAVSAWNKDIEIKDGHLLYPQTGGSHFLPLPIPRQDRYEDMLLLSPKRAAQMAAAKSGGEPTGQVELIIQPGVLPQFAVWRVQLQANIEVQDPSGRNTSVSYVYVGAFRPSADGQVTISDPDSNKSFALRYRNRSGERASVAVETRGGYAVVDRVPIIARR